jgi:putative RecB family exonuclease
VPVWSHSRLSAFEKCPLQYRYRYVDRIRKDTFGIEGFLGNRVHEALEHLYRRKAEAKKTPKLNEVLEVYGARWDAEYNDKVRIVRRGLLPADYRLEGEKYLRGFYHRNSPFDDGETLGLEVKVEFALDAGGRYPIVGYIDRLVRRQPGMYEIHDYKTTAFRPSDEELRRDRQLTFYQIAVRDRHADARDVRLVWHFLAQGDRRTATRTESEIEEHRRQAIRLVDKIEAARDFPARPGPLCRWCEYRDICPMEKHKVAAEAAAAERRRHADSERFRAAAGRPFVKAEQVSLGLPGVPEPGPVPTRRKRGAPKRPAEAAAALPPPEA